ncbi:hypothetical protein NL405_28045, partial [Klebsiella pneumoniae]|nr:hypothetical protein [Klebsiella pneumoniae]
GGGTLSAAPPLFGGWTAPGGCAATVAAIAVPRTPLASRIQTWRVLRMVTSGRGKAQIVPELWN